MFKLSPLQLTRVFSVLVVFTLSTLMVRVISKSSRDCEDNDTKRAPFTYPAHAPTKRQVEHVEDNRRGGSTVPEWERKWNFTGFNNETGTVDGRYIIPNYVHFVKFHHPTFSFVHMVCILAALKNQRPEKLFIHTDVKEFKGDYWQLLLNTPGFKEVLVVNRVELPTSVFGQPINPEWIVYHGGDVARLAVMRQFGGIYIDSDSYLIRSLDDLRRYEFVAAWRRGRSMMNQVVLAHKDARLLQEWQEGYRDYKPDLWYFNAGRQPARTLERAPHLIHSVPDLLGTYDLRTKIYLKSWPEWKLFYSCHLMTRWMNSFRGVSYPDPIRPEDVLLVNNTFREMVQDVYDLSRLNGR